MQADVIGPASSSLPPHFFCRSTLPPTIQGSPTAIRPGTASYASTNTTSEVLATAWPCLVRMHASPTPTDHACTHAHAHGRCVFERGEDHPRCQFYERSYQSLCPADWVSCMQRYVPLCLFFSRRTVPAFQYVVYVIQDFFLFTVPHFNCQCSWRTGTSCVRRACGPASTKSVAKETAR